MARSPFLVSLFISLGYIIVLEPLVEKKNFFFFRQFTLALILKPIEHLCVGLYLD